MNTLEYKSIKVTWLGHASFQIRNKLVIYIDPYDIPEGLEKADIVFVTHEHYDHCSPSDIKKIFKEDTTVVATEDCISKLKEFKIFPSIIAFRII